MLKPPDSTKTNNILIKKLVKQYSKGKELFQCGSWFQALISTCKCQTKTKGKNQVYKTEKVNVQNFKRLLDRKKSNVKKLKDADITEIFKIKILVKEKKGICACAKFSDRINYTEKQMHLNSPATLEGNILLFLGNIFTVPELNNPRDPTIFQLKGDVYIRMQGHLLN